MELWWKEFSKPHKVCKIVPDLSIAWQTLTVECPSTAAPVEIMSDLTSIRQELRQRIRVNKQILDTLEPMRDELQSKISARIEAGLWSSENDRLYNDLNQVGERYNEVLTDLVENTRLLKRVVTKMAELE